MSTSTSTSTNSTEKPLLRPFLPIPRIVRKDPGPDMGAQVRDFEQTGGCYFWPITSYSGSGTGSGAGSGAANPIYAFDMDGTLIKTRSGKAFAKDAEDWQFLFPEVPTKLRHLLQEGAYILIITNQKGISSGKTLLSDIRTKISAIIDKVCLEKRERGRFGVYIAGKADRYRKPWTGIWTLLPEEQRRNVRWYCGDAAGRVGDIHPSDRYFAENEGIPFHTPEEIFLDAPRPRESDYKPYPAAPYLPVPENTTTSEYSVKFAELIDRLQAQPKTLVIMVGGPGSGKSSIAREVCQTQALSGSDKNGGAVHIERDALGGNQKRFLRAIGTEMQNSGRDWVFADATHPNAGSRELLLQLAPSRGWSVLFLNIDVPLELALHQDSVRVQLGHRPKPIPLVAHRTFHKRYREDIENRTNEINAGRWIIFNAPNPQFTSLPEYQMKFC